MTTPTHRAKHSVNARQLTEPETVVTHRGPIDAITGQYVVNHLVSSLDEDGNTTWSPQGIVTIHDESDFDEQFGSSAETVNDKRPKTSKDYDERELSRPFHAEITPDANEANEDSDSQEADKDTRVGHPYAPPLDKTPSGAES